MKKPVALSLLGAAGLVVLAASRPAESPAGPPAAQVAGDAQTPERTVAAVVHWGESEADAADLGLHPALLELPPDGVYASTDGIHFYPEGTSSEDLAAPAELAFEMSADERTLGFLAEVMDGKAEMRIRLGARTARARALGFEVDATAANACQTAPPPDCLPFTSSCADKPPFVKRCMRVRFHLIDVCTCVWWIW